MPSAEKIYTVSEILQSIQNTMEEAYQMVWVEGEISNFKAPPSGHFYFILKDEQANLKVVMFRGSNQYLRFNPENGQKVLVKGRITVYPARGDMQLVAENLEPRGKGALQLAFEQLKEKLRKEGLFESARKRSLPFFVQRIAVITSRSGAVIRDIVKITKRRAPYVEIVLYSVRVQGEGSAFEIAQALKDVNQLRNFDVVILARGGGSLEDLWSFNEEIVARAIAASKIPVISAIGHEVDFTIADFVADLRAPTPSAAAEIAVRDRRDLREILRHYFERTVQVLLSAITQGRDRLHDLRNRRVLKRPSTLIEDLYLRIDQASAALSEAMRKVIREQEIRLRGSSRELNAVSPLAILNRGYSITWKYPENEVIHSQDQVENGILLKTRVSKGVLFSRVEKKQE